MGRSPWSEVRDGTGRGDGFGHMRSVCVHISLVSIGGWDPKGSSAMWEGLGHILRPVKLWVARMLAGVSRGVSLCAGVLGASSTSTLCFLAAGMAVWWVL